MTGERAPTVGESPPRAARDGPAPIAAVPRWSLSPGRQVAIVLAVLAFLATRRADQIVRPQLIGEDGIVFFSESHQLGAVVSPLMGYLHLVPRLIAIATAPLPWEWMPLVWHLLALAIAALVSWRVLMARIPRAAAIAGAIAIVAVPNNGDPFASVACLHLILTAVLAVNLLEPAPGSRGEAIRRTVEVSLCALSGPEALVGAPLALLRLWHWRRQPWGRLPMVAWLAGGAVQGLMLASQGRRMAPSAWVAFPSPGVLAGYARTLFFRWAGPETGAGLAAGAGLAVLLVVVVLALWRRQGQRWPALGCLAGALVLLMSARFVLKQWPDAFGADSRLVYMPYVLVFWALGWIASGAAGWRRGLAVLLMAAIAVSALSRWPYSGPEMPDCRWARQIAEFRAGQRVILDFPAAFADGSIRPAGHVAPGRTAPPATLP